MRAHPNLRNVNFNWNDRVKSVRVEIDQARARALGVSSQDVALTLQGWLTGATVTQFRENDQLIDVVWRVWRAGAAEEDAKRTSNSGGGIPLAGDGCGFASGRRAGNGKAAAAARAALIWTSFPPAAGTFRWPRWRAWCRCSRRA
jgi:hypothetical protein